MAKAFRQAQGKSGGESCYSLEPVHILELLEVSYK